MTKLLIQIQRKQHRPGMTLHTLMSTGTPVADRNPSLGAVETIHTAILTAVSVSIWHERLF